MNIKLIPTDFETTIYECPPGLFLFEKTVGFKDGYGGDPCCADTGEIFWGGAKTVEERKKLKVIPCVTVISEGG